MRHCHHHISIYIISIRLQESFSEWYHIPFRNTKSKLISVRKHAIIGEICQKERVAITLFDYHLSFRNDKI